MSIPWRSRRRDLGLRLAGLILLLAGALCFVLLCSREGAASVRCSTLAAAGLAAASFLCLSTGALLLVLGLHLFDTVPISARWTRRA